MLSLLLTRLAYSLYSRLFKNKFPKFSACLLAFSFQLNLYKRNEENGNQQSKIISSRFHHYTVLNDTLETSDNN